MNSISMAWTESQLAEGLAKKDEAAFEQVFKTHFKNLHGYAMSMLKDETIAEEAVQNVFLRLWDRGDQFHFNATLTAYLYKAVHNESLNHLKHEQVRQQYSRFAKQTMHHPQQENTSGKVLVSELEQKIKTALNELPEQCRTIFQLSRFEELKYQEIADKLNLSVKTVEAQMGKALRLMRLKLADYLPLILLFFNL